MKTDIHPKVFDAKVTCASCGTTWVTTSTSKELRIDVCSNCHPFYTGESAKLLDVEGQVDRFYKKLSARQNYVEDQKAREESTNISNRSVDDLGLTPRATDGLKRAGVLNIGQLVEKFAEGDAALLAINGFGQSALTAAKKKLRSLEIELPEPPKVEKAEKAEKATETPEAGE
ncbi:MAG: 50S ribosomal protein L31 [Anaerolineales bacterium]|jgi:large subunit ribosomal protein L31|uniref:50S ribosomal protein L31 n=1 Tax=Candidatus Villigracilis vicinus TaxID=3140679 RepID=UPI0031353E70|nr:50S ribosomal protein L31 [Anaerolineales bacterium]MBK7448014.1 50S ribosomal protein L31 [Anaerolineales bacterium]MBK9778885.1 50S ribosomal protein L31 [Anaerolineales bacterium]